MSRYVYIIEEGQAEYLGKLVETGLYGESREIVVAGLVLAGIRQAIADGIIKLREPDAEEDPEAAPVQAPEPHPAFAVSRCPDCKEPLSNGKCVSLECMPF